MIRKRNLRNSVSKNRNTNEKLYESIMKNISKKVKKHLNEYADNQSLSRISNEFYNIQENSDDEDEVIDQIISMIIESMTHSGALWELAYLFQENIIDPDIFYSENFTETFAGKFSDAVYLKDSFNLAIENDKIVRAHDDY